jgi:hypothetical protein
MVMLEEFRRRKKLKDYFELMRKRERDQDDMEGNVKGY